MERLVIDFPTKNIAFPSKTNYIPKIIKIIKKIELKKDKNDKETLGFYTI